MVQKPIIIGGVVLGLVLLILGGILGLVGANAYVHYELDHRNHHAMAEIIQYNLQQGKLLPVPQAVPQVAPTPEKSPKD